MRFPARISLLTLLLVTTAAALSIANPSKRETICQECQGMYDFCVSNGHSEGQTACKQTCIEHVCHRMAQCKGCGGEFLACPVVSRYPN